MEFVLGDAWSLSAIRTTIRSSSSQRRGHDGRDFPRDRIVRLEYFARNKNYRAYRLFLDASTGSRSESEKNRCDTIERSLRDRELPFALLHDGETIPYLQIGWHFLRFGEYIWRRERDWFRCVVNRENFECGISNGDARTLVCAFRLSELFNFKFTFSN